MLDNKINSNDFKVWNRNIINTYWLVSLLCVIGQILFLILDIKRDPNYSIQRFLIKYMLKPDSIILLTLIVTELIYRYSKKLNKYLIIATSIVMVYAVFFNVKPEIPGRQIVIIIPILISVLYLNRRVLAVSCLIDVSILWLAYIIFPSQREILSVFELIIVTITCLSAAIIGIGIVNRGIQLLNSITALARNEEKLIIEKSIIDKLSKTDALTGLYNHRTFHDYIDTLLNQHNLYSFQIQLAIIDIDNFKKVNDTYGHWSGDIVLKEVANILNQTITPDDFAARYGGEEFAIIFIGKPLSDTLKMLESLRETISKRTFEVLENGSVTVSIGVCNYLNAHNKELLFKGADSALYSAKTSGKNKIICGSSL
jgi:two-component system cell cycle response regulator